jgi:hypothetical protein
MKALKKNLAQSLSKQFKTRSLIEKKQKQHPSHLKSEKKI